MTPAEISLATRLFPQEKQLLARATPAYLCFGDETDGFEPRLESVCIISHEPLCCPLEGCEKQWLPLVSWGHCPWRGTGSLLDPKMRKLSWKRTLKSPAVAASPLKSVAAFDPQMQVSGGRELTLSAPQGSLLGNLLAQGAKPYLGTYGLT